MKNRDIIQEIEAIPQHGAFYYNGGFVVRTGAEWFAVYTTNENIHPYYKEVAVETDATGAGQFIKDNE